MRTAPRQPPPRPRPWQEHTANGLYLALSPRLRRCPPIAPPRALVPFRDVVIPRRGREGRLFGTFYPAPNAVRGSVLLVHPWLPVGRAYFHRRGRITALRRAGYHVLTCDLSGFGGSAEPRGFFDRDVADALSWLEAHGEGDALHLWGISAGGVWSHPVLSQTGRVAGAIFEDVSPHLLEWSGRLQPWGMPCYAFFRHALPRAYRFLDLRQHAPHLRARAIAYVGGDRDPGIRPQDTHALAELAGGHAMIVPQAGHLEAIKRAGTAVIDLALRTFERAEATRPARHLPPPAMMAATPSPSHPA